MILNRIIAGLAILCCIWGTPSLADELVETHCYGYLTELLRTSDFPFRDVSKEKVNLLIDDDQGDKIIAQLVYDKPERGVEDSNPTAQIGWITYDLKQQQLLNTSAYLDKPQKLTFDKTYAVKLGLCRNQPKATSQTTCEIINKQITNQIVALPKPLETYIVIGKGRLYFYSAPDNKCKISNNLFIINNDFVEAYSQYGNFYYAKYIGKNTTVEGWVYKNRLKSTDKNIETNDASLTDNLTQLPENNKPQFKDDFPKYCRDLNEGKIFEGSDKYLCFYSNKSLLEIYTRIKNITNDGQVLRDKITAMKNITYTKDDVDISYKWINSKQLRLVVSLGGGSEITTYLFKENSQGTSLEITVETGY